MKRFLGYPGTSKSSTSHDRANQNDTCLLKKKKKKKENLKERDFPQRSQEHTDRFSHLRAT